MLPGIPALVHPDHCGRYATVLAPDWHPDQATEFNGAVWPCLGSAVWALRTTTSFEDAIRAAIDLEGDTDTVAAVTGAIASAYYGLDAMPAHWTQPLHTPLPGFDGSVLRLPDLLTSHTASETEPVLDQHRIMPTNALIQEDGGANVGGVDAGEVATLDLSDVVVAEAMVLRP